MDYEMEMVEGLTEAHDSERDYNVAIEDVEIAEMELFEIMGV